MCYGSSNNELTEIGMEANRRDAGLIRSVGAWSLAASIVCIVVGAGVFAVPGALAASIGPYAPIAILVCATAIASVAICFAEAGSRIASSGGVYGCIHAAFGPLVGYVGGMLLWIGNVLACGGIAAALADVTTDLLPQPLKMPAHAFIVVGVIGTITFVNIGGVTRGMRLVSLATLLKLLPLVIFVVVGASAVHGRNYLPTAAPSAAGLGRALLLALFAFTGMEGSLCASGEVADPNRSIPRALALALGAVTLLYVAIQVVAQGILGPSLAQSTVPLADAMARISPGLRLLMLGGAAVSMFGWLSGDILSTPRMLFAFARDGWLPSPLGRLHGRTNVPHVSIICYAAIATGLAITGTFAELAVLATLASAMLYILGCGAAWQLARHGVAEAGTPLNFRWLFTAVVVGISSMLVLIALASQGEIIGLFVLVGVCVAIYLLQARVAVRRA
jgi:APA family basic amino acid/polyamine antiporter